MNRLKSLFLTLFMVLSTVVMAVAAMVVATGGHLSIWVSVFAASAQVVVYFSWLYLAKVPRTSPGLMGFTVGIFVATMYSVFTSYEQQSPSIAPLLAFVVMVGWMGYTTWYSDLGDRSSNRIKVGRKLPDLTLVNLKGEAVQTREWAGHKRLVIFYRGNWCPICTAQIGELRKFKHQFAELGVMVSLISPQPPAKSGELAQRDGTDFEFLFDPDNASARKLGILHPDALPVGFGILGYGRDMPKPTTFALDENGKVVYADLTANYRLRPHPKDILAALA